MNIVLLAGGVSNRFKPLNSKNFLNIGGYNLVDYNLAELENLDFIENIFIIYHPSFDAEFKEIKASHPHVVLVPQEFEGGMSGAILSLPDSLKDALIININDMLDPNFIVEFVEYIKQNSPKNLILGKQVSKHYPVGYLEIDDQNNLSNIIEKPEKGSEPSDLINLVYHYFSDLERFKNLIKQTELKDDSYELALKALAQEEEVKVFPYQGSWQTLKKPQMLIDMLRHLLKHNKVKTGSENQIHETAIIEPSVKLGKNVKIDAYTILKGDTYIGDNSYVGSYTQIRDSHIGEDCLIGSNCEITRSYVGDRASMHANYFGDSFVGNDCFFGYGVTTANMRLDDKLINGEKKQGATIGDGVKIACHVLLNPGVKIGANTIIASKTVISKDVEPNSYVKAKHEIDIRENKN